ncbi:DUF397 domain-containing protein [Nocardia testacea]|uniref:DUF397 domain-containing protein n=1 Tax=Nocardia testacea TaxID=248551 RepID=A0ABW7W495_9NOCA|nr:DUF397 domain-containing protein [Nocardia testacea]
MTDHLDWRVSSYTDKHTCVEVAAAPTGEILVRNSNNRAAGHIAFTRDEFSAWLKGCKAGEFDDLGF